MQTNETTRTLKVTITVPDGVIGLLEGPYRKEMAEAMKGSKCVYEIRPSPVGNEVRDIVIAGRSQERIEGGKRIFNDLVERLRAEDAENNQIIEEDEGEGRNNQWRNIITEQLKVPTNLAGFIVGGGQERIRNISSKSGAAITTDVIDDFAVFDVTGTREQVAECQKMIQSKVDYDTARRRHTRRKSRHPQASS